MLYFLSFQDNSQDLQISSVTTEKSNEIDDGCDNASADFGLKISSIASESNVGSVTEQNSINENDSETSNNDTGDTGIKISSFASSVNNDLSNQEGNTESENTGIKISNVARVEESIVEEDSGGKSAQVGGAHKSEI